MSIEIKVQNHIFVFLLDPTLRNTIIYRKSSKDKLDFLFREVRGECTYNIGKERNKELKKYKNLYLEALDKFEKLKVFL